MILQGKGIEKSYRSSKMETPVLKDIDIEIKKGEFVAIMGKSGSGKSTLLNILSTLDKSDRGEVFFEGIDISHLTDEDASKLRRESFGFVFQLPKMVRNLTILDNIMLPSTRYKTDRKRTIEKARSLMNRLGIEDLADKRTSQASGGQLQRAGICRALINDPKLIFADEPTGALDSKSGMEVLQLFSELHTEGKSILLVTHDIHVASNADRVLFMKDGRLYREIVCRSDVKRNLSNLQKMIEDL